MKDAALFIFFCATYAVIGLNLFGNRFAAPEQPLNWHGLLELFGFFSLIVLLARWTVIAFKPGEKNFGLAEGQKIEGVEIQKSDTVMDVLKPQIIEKEKGKPKLRKIRKPRR